MKIKHVGLILLLLFCAFEIITAEPSIYTSIATLAAFGVSGCVGAEIAYSHADKRRRSRK